MREYKMIITEENEIMIFEEMDNRVTCEECNFEKRGNMCKFCINTSGRKPYFYAKGQVSEMLLKIFDGDMNFGSVIQSSSTQANPVEVRSREAWYSELDRLICAKGMDYSIGNAINLLVSAEETKNITLINYAINILDGYIERIKYLKEFREENDETNTDIS